MLILLVLSFYIYFESISLCFFYTFFKTHHRRTLFTIILRFYHQMNCEHSWRIRIKKPAYRILTTVAPNRRLLREKKKECIMLLFRVGYVSTRADEILFLWLPDIYEHKSLGASNIWTDGLSGILNQLIRDTKSTLVFMQNALILGLLNKKIEDVEINNLLVK